MAHECFFNGRNKIGRSDSLAWIETDPILEISVTQRDGCCRSPQFDQRLNIHLFLTPRTMKKGIIISLSIIMFISCVQESQIEEKKGENSTKSKWSKAGSMLDNGETYLCKVDGENWGYTEGSGLVTKNKKTGDRLAIFTFTRGKGKQKETIQIRYNVNTNMLVNVLLRLTKTDKEGNKRRPHYNLVNESQGYMGDIETKAIVDVSNPNQGNGSAQFVGYMMFNSSGFSDKDFFIEITNLKFSNIGYADINKFNSQMERLKGDG